MNPLPSKPSVQYWLDLVGYMSERGMCVLPLAEFLKNDGATIKDLAELLIPYHAPDGKKYGFTIYILDKPNFVPAIEEMLALKEMAPAIVERFGSLCKEVAV